MGKICTMMKSTSFCKLPAKRGYKWPKLDELHQTLFGCDFEGAHDAGSDVLATVKCFFELVRLGVIEMPVIEQLPE
jgi:DNA polymerase-3 subunit epsilon